MNANILSDSEIRRFQSQMNFSEIGKEGQLKIKLAKVAIIGAGGIGVSVLQYLASIGVGNFGIIDDGIVDELNIQKQTVYGAADLGKLKTIITRQKLQNIFPLSNYEIINLRLSQENSVKVLNPYDLVIDASNKLGTNILINDACIKMNKSWIYGSVSGSEIKTTVFNYLGGPSFRCYRNISSDSINGKEQLGHISLAFGFVGILMATEALKVLTGQSNTLSGKMYSFHIFSYQSRSDAIEKIDKFFQTTSV